MSEVDDLKGNGAFCAMPWLHFHVTTLGQATPCCLSPEPLLDDDGKPFHIHTHSISEIWTSNAYKKLRAEMRAGKRPSACNTCYKNEDAAGASTRAAINDWLFDTHDRAQLNRQIVIDEGDGAAPPIPGYVDVRLSNLCNLGCRMCSAGSSSQIEGDPVHSLWAPNPAPAALSGGNAAALNDRDSPVLDDLKTLSDLYYIQLAGGEPTVNKAQVAWLTSLAESGAARKIDLAIWTNFTTSNRAIFDAIGEFRRVQMVLSLDGHGPTFDYIRWPGRWSMIERNMAYIAPLRSRIHLQLNCVLQAYNVDNIQTLCDWARTNEVLVMIHHVTGPDQLDYRVLSPQKQEQVRRSLADYAASMGTSDVDASIRTAIEEVLARTAEPFEEPKRAALLDAFVAMTNDLDRQRHQSIKTAIPAIHDDVAAMFGGTWPPHGCFTEPKRVTEVPAG